MQRLTENDRGTFLVTTHTGTEHTWVITDEGVTVTRRSNNPSHISMENFPKVPYAALVKEWPVVGGRFFNILLDGEHRGSWTYSSQVKTIERVA